MNNPNRKGGNDGREGLRILFGQSCLLFLKKVLSLKIPALAKS